MRARLLPYRHCFESHIAVEAAARAFYWLDMHSALCQARLSITMEAYQTECEIAEEVLLVVCDWFSVSVLMRVER